MSQHNQNPYLNLYPMQQPANQQQPQNWYGQQQMPQQPSQPMNSSYPAQTMQNPYASRQNSASSSLMSDRFLKGLLIGAAAAYILTNESVQRTAIKGAVKAWSLMQGGVEEIKERFQDAEAELRAESDE